MTENEESDELVPEGAAVLPEIPAELGVQPLFLAVLHAVVFLIGSTDDVIDPDAAVEATEYLALYLHRLSSQEFERVREDLAALTTYARQEGWPKSQQRFFKEFLETFGIGEEDEA